MRLNEHTTASDFDLLPEWNQYFLLRWKEKQGYPKTKEFSFFQIFELSLALTNDLEFDASEERFSGVFNNYLNYEEMRIAWQGEQPTDIYFYELNKKLQRRIYQYLAVQEGKRR